jgi:hypothetical protein
VKTGHFHLPHPATAKARKPYDPETDDTPKCCSCEPQAAYLGVIALKNPRKQGILFDLKRAI